MPSKREDIAKHREREAWRLRVEGWTQQRIAEHLGMDQSTVSDSLKRIEQALAVEFKADALQIKARQTAVLEHVADEALQRWRESVGEVEKVTTVTGRVKTTENGVFDLPDQVTRSVEYQSGNPALLEKAMSAMADVRKIWGLDEPTKVDANMNVTEKKTYVVSSDTGDWTQEV